MCTSTATILYGLWVTTASLAFAATAHYRTRSPFRAIDLILLRRRSGSLKVGGNEVNALVMMPPEVWEQVKQRLIYLEARVAELQAIAPMLRCNGCSEADFVGSLFIRAMLGVGTATSDGVKGLPLVHEWDEWGPPPNDCQDCWESVWEDSLDLLSTETIEHIKSLLGPFGLCMPVNSVWSSDPGVEYHDFDSLSPISLPLRGFNSTKFPQVEAEQDHNYEYTSSHAVANISPAIFNLPPDVHLRFASLVKTYGLEVVDRTTSEILTAQPPPSKAKAQENRPKGSKIGGAGSPKGKEQEKKDKRELKFGRVEPRWMLWSVGDPCT